jgi:hypothetical protein
VENAERLKTEVMFNPQPFCFIAINYDGVAKSRKTVFLVIPAKAGIQVLRTLTEDLDPGFHRGDGFLRDRQIRMTL